MAKLTKISVTPSEAENKANSDNVYTKSEIDAIFEAKQLPSVTAADNGKVLMVVDGAWAVVDLSTLTGETTE